MQSSETNGKPIIYCKNCSDKVIGKFCSNCGQSSSTKVVDRKFIVNELHDTVLRFNNNFLFTIKELFLRPGQMINDYINGKRIKYFRPISYLLLLVALNTTLEHNLGRQTSFEESISLIRSSLFEGKYSDSNIYKIFDWIMNHEGYSFLMMIPLLSLASYLAFIPAKKNYFKHLILNIYVNSQVIIIYTISTLAYSLFNTTHFEKYLDIINQTLTFLYSFYAYYLFFDQIKPIKRIFLILLSKFLVFIFLICLVIFIAFLI